MTPEELAFIQASEDVALAALKLCDLMERQGWPNPEAARCAAQIRAAWARYIEESNG
jgi:hypothetical protein